MRKFLHLFTAALCICLIAAPSYAQQTGGTQTGGAGANIANMVAQGATQQQITAALQTAGINLSPQQLSTMATNLMGQNAAGITNLVNGITSGGLPALAGLNLSGIPGLGTLTQSAAQFTSWLNNPSIQSLLGGLGGGLGNAIQSAFNAFTGGGGVTGAVASAAASAIASAFPSVAAAAGGVAGVASALTGGGLGAITGGGTPTATGSAGFQCGRSAPGNNSTGESCGDCGLLPTCIAPSCVRQLNGCSGGCVATSEQQMNITTEFITNEFTFHRRWMVEQFFQRHLLPAMQLFAEQISAAAMAQVVSVGMFLDAKHQLETQRIFQEMTARAHKDYHPSEGMCTFGTNVRSLAASDRNTDLTAMGISNRVLQRELLSGSAVAGGGQSSDYLSRIAQFRTVYCDASDNGQGLALLCPGGARMEGRRNRDINYTAALETPLTLELDLTEEGDPDHQHNRAGMRTVSPDEEDLFALSANLYAHNVAPTIPQSFLSDENGVPNAQGVNHYMNIRAIAAKRSVARNSFASIAAMKSQGETQVQPYLFAIMREMGIAEDQVPLYLGERPSYHAQMEILTKKLYQNPTFYTELYDKPANVDRKLVSMQAIDLMQRRDIYRSVLRSEAILAVMLETALGEQQDKVSNEINRMTAEGELVTLPATP